MPDNKTRIPRLYKIAAKIAKDVHEGKGSIKTLVYEAKHPNTSALTALVTNTFQRMDLLDQLMKKSKLLINEPKLNPWVAKILITELFWGKKRLLKLENIQISTILAYEQILKAHLSDAPIPDEDSREQVTKPRYVRVNTVLITVDEVIDGFQNEGWILKQCSDKNDYPAFLEAVTSLGPKEFMVDLHIPYLLIFPPKTVFYNHVAYKQGYIMLQDKASCLPVHALNPTPGSTVLDMCASPGMKTTQLAALMQNEGTIYAVEMGTKRFQTLNKMIETSGATCVKTINRDTLTLTEKELPDVEYILVDPSCSGSGIIERVEIGQQKKDQEQDRLVKLSNLQVMLLRHALIRYSKAKRIVYSTCSMFPEENEDVVRRVLETCTNFKLVPAGPVVNDAWFHYGSSDFGDIGNYCLKTNPEIDLTTGFFVAVFERLQRGEKNPFFNLPEKKKKRKKKINEEPQEDENTPAENEQVNEGNVEDSKVKDSGKKRKKKHVDQNEQVVVENEEENFKVNKKEHVDGSTQHVQNEDHVKLKTKKKKRETESEDKPSKKIKTEKIPDSQDGKQIKIVKEEKQHIEDEQFDQKKKKKNKSDPDVAEINTEAVVVKEEISSSVNETETNKEKKKKSNKIKLNLLPKEKKKDKRESEQQAPSEENSLTQIAQDLTSYLDLKLKKEKIKT